MTNNSQRTSLKVVRKLGIAVTENHVYTSAMTTGKFLADNPRMGPHICLLKGVTGKFVRK